MNIKNTQMGLPLGDNRNTQDIKRLGKVARAVYQVMSDGQWHTLPGIKSALDAVGVNAMETSISAAIRCFRRAEHGSNQVDSEKTLGSTGLWRYRVTPANVHVKHKLVWG